MSSLSSSTLLPDPTAATMDPGEASGDVTTNHTETDDQGITAALQIVTYVGASVAIAGILLTLLSYVGYRKFHIKRPHIVMVNLCVCLFLYYLGYIISNRERHSDEHVGNHICVFGAIACHFSILAAWFWILIYWTLVLVMFQRPMGGHISHFFIKALIPSYGIPLVITIACAVVAHQKGEISQGTYYGSLCFVDNLYRYVGSMLPMIICFIPMVIVFAILLRGVFFSNDERLKNSKTRKNIKMHMTRLAIITVLLATVAACGFIQHDKATEASMILFGVVSSVLGLALMVLFCLNRGEIRSHWVSVIRGGENSLRKHSVNRAGYEIGDGTTSRKSSTLMANHPSVYIDNFDEYERKSSTYRIVAKEDTDMSTLGMIQIPGTPSPNRTHDANGEKTTTEGTKVRRKKSDASSKMRNTSHQEGNDGSGTSTSKKKKTRSTSSPPVSPAQKSTKRQHSSNAIITSPGKPESHKKQTKRANSSNRLSRTKFIRKSTSTIDEDTVQLTDFK